MFKSGQVPSFQSIKELKLDFPKEIKRNEFQTYFITEFEQGTAFIYSAFFTSDEDRDGNVGTPLIFIINQDLNLSTNLE